MKTSYKNERNRTLLCLDQEFNAAYNNCICDNEMQKWQSKDWHSDIGTYVAIFFTMSSLLPRQSKIVQSKLRTWKKFTVHSLNCHKQYVL